MSNPHYIISSSYDKYFLNRAEYFDNFLYVYNYLINHGVALGRDQIEYDNPTYSSVLDMLVVLDSISALNPGFIQSGFSQPEDIHFKGRLGIFGWCDNRDNPHDIINPLMWYANKNNKPWWDIDLQLDLLMHCDDDEIKKCGTNEFVWGWKNINQYCEFLDSTLPNNNIHTLPKPITFDVFKSGSLISTSYLNPHGCVNSYYHYDPLVALICGLFHVSAFKTDHHEAKLLVDGITKNYYSKYVQEYVSYTIYPSEVQGTYTTKNMYSLKNLLNITTDITTVYFIIRRIIYDYSYDGTLNLCRTMYYFEFSGPVFVYFSEYFGSKLVTFNNNQYYVDPVNVIMPYYSTSGIEHNTDFINQNAEITYDEYRDRTYREVHYANYPVGGIIVASMPGDTPPAVFPFKIKHNYQPWMSKRKNLEKVKRYV